VLEIPILDSSTASVKKPVGLLHVSILRARNLLKKDLLGTSDPYVKLSLTGEKLPAKKTTIKKRNLNPEWNEHFKLIVKDPNSQVLQLEVFDWDKVHASNDPISSLVQHFMPFLLKRLCICIGRWARQIRNADDPFAKD
jgi:Ca2+-dependent lipid-binding protein